MFRVVFDTNVYISAFTSPGSKGEEAYFLAVRGRVELFTSVSILTELAGKLKDKFYWDDEKIQAVLKHISKVSTVIKPAMKISLLRDEPDNRILECARAAKAALIVTGDRHLLALKEFEGIGISRTAGFLYTFHEKGASTT